MLNADWVQLNCRCLPIKVGYCKLDYDDTGKVRRHSTTGWDYHTVLYESVETNQVQWHKDYRVEKQNIRTKYAASIYYVYFKNTRICEVITDVDSGVIDSQTVFVRFDNKFLYGVNLYDRVVKFLQENSLVFHNWTRFDVCCDFNFMMDSWGKKQLCPAAFIKSFLSERVKLLNKRRGKTRKGGVYFESGSAGIEVQTMYLGSPTSAIRTKMYNKTRELQQKEDKPHIREQWALNTGIDTSIDVWRLEFQISDFGNVGVKDDVLKFTMKSLDILKDENLRTLWNCLREHYFVFYRSTTRKNVTREQKLKLFDFEETGIKLVDISEKENTTRSTKIFIKKLLNTIQGDLRNHSAMKNLAFTTDFVAAHLVSKHDLAEWAASRFPGWKYENYTEPPIMDIPVIQFSLLPDGTRQSQKHSFSL